MNFTIIINNVFHVLNYVQHVKIIQIIVLQLLMICQIQCGKNQVLIDNICINQCGDGILTNEYEECDDGNDTGGDGCSNYCLIEDDYQCTNQQGSLSLCTFIQAPGFNLNVLTDNSQSIQIVELTFTQQIQLKEIVDLDQIIIFTITPQTQYKITIKYISNLTITLNNPQFLIFIEFIQPILDPTLLVDIDKSFIHNAFKISLLCNQKTVNLGTPFVLSETSQQQLTSIVQLNDIMIYSMTSVSCLAFLTGNPIMFFNLLDLLQSLSYLRFMYTQFPPHLIVFLNTYTKVSLQPIFNYFKIDQFLEELNVRNSSNHIDNKLQQDSKIILNQLYLFNVKSCYFSVFASFLTYLIYCLLVGQSLQTVLFKLFNKYHNNYKILRLIHIFQIKIQKQCLKSKKEYFSLGIFQVFQAILHQFTFSVLLQFHYYKFDSPFEIINSINAIFGLLFILMYITPLLSITTNQIKNKNKWKYFYFESKTSFWAIQYKSFQIYKTIFYILVIVELINYPEIQSILLSVHSLVYLVYLIKFKPLLSAFELSKQICREFLFTIITGTFLLYSFKFDQDKFIFLGWIHITMFCAILGSNILIDLIQLIKKFYDIYLKKRQQQKMQLEKQTNINNGRGNAIILQPDINFSNYQQ